MNDNTSKSSREELKVQSIYRSKMLLLSTCCIVIVLSLAGVTSLQDKDLPNGHDSTEKARKGLSILIATLPLTGHITPAVALGEELVRRGHNVTLCTTVLEGKDLAKTMSERAGMGLLSAGKSFLSYEQYLNVVQKADLRNLTGMLTEVKRTMWFLFEEPNFIGKKIDSVNVTEFDVIISTEFLSQMTACLSKKWGVPGIILSTTLQFQPHHMPPWPFPPIMARKRGTLETSDNLSFFQRLANVPIGWLVDFIWSVIYRVGLSYLEFADECPLNYVAQYPGVYAPQIIPTAIGFEYPRSMTPLTHYVGPILTMRRQTIPADILSWLDSKPKGSVLLISMGSTAHLYPEHALAVVNALNVTGVSAIWSLRESNQDILDGLEFDKDQLCVHKWLPQVSVLNHSSVGMAMLHGGMNGVHEALYHGVPAIVVPGTSDQGDVAARLDHSKAGVQILKSYLNNDTLISAIKSLQSGKHLPYVARLQRTFIQAGGSQRAAELVEHYSAVGYDHLIPAYAKYNWSWVQYYNVDVYALLMCVGVLMVYLLTKCCCLWKRCCCGSKQNTVASSKKNN